MKRKILILIGLALLGAFLWVLIVGIQGSAQFREAVRHDPIWSQSH